MIPRNVKTRAVAAKNASGRVLYVRQRVVSELLHDFRLIFAGFVTVKPRCNAPVAARGCGELRRIIPKHRRRACARQRRLFAVRFGCVQLRADAQQLARHPRQRPARHRQLKPNNRLKQHVFRLHQRIADRAAGRFTKVAALCVLEVRAPCNQPHMHIRQRAARQHAGMLPLKDVRANQPLPVLVQRIGRAVRRKRDAAPRRAGFQPEPYLGIVPQRLVMPDAHDGRVNRLLVEHMRRQHAHPVAKARR